MKAYTPDRCCIRCGACYRNKDDRKHKSSYQLTIYDKEEGQFYVADLCSSCYKKLQYWVESADAEEPPFGYG